MTNYDNTNRGTLGKNRRKEKDSHPEYTGTLNVEGKEYWLSGWVKDGPENSKFFSLSVKPKEAKPQGNSSPQPSNNAPFPDDDIPF